jgi:hypothetical protein
MLLLILVIVLLAVRVRRALVSHPPTTAILQSPVSAFQCDLLLERQPVVLNGVDPLRVRHLVGCMALHSTRSVAHGKQLARAAYTLLWPAQESTQVDIAHPRFRQANARTDALVGEFVRVQLRPNQALVVPFAWTYRCEAPMHRMELWDVTHAIARLLL